MSSYSTSTTSPTSPPTSRHNGTARRPPFPHSVEVMFDPATTSPALLFNFTHTSRHPTGDATKAAAFHASSLLDTHYDPIDRNQDKIVQVPYPAGLKRLYYARAGNVGLEFQDETGMKQFQEGILGVGHTMVREDAGLYRVYLGDKVRENAEAYAGYRNQGRKAYYDGSERTKADYGNSSHYE